jgi:hypothetical protein
MPRGQNSKILNNNCIITIKHIQFPCGKKLVSKDERFYNKLKFLHIKTCPICSDTPSVFLHTGNYDVNMTQSKEADQIRKKFIENNVDPHFNKLIE